MVAMSGGFVVPCRLVSDLLWHLLSAVERASFRASGLAMVDVSSG